MRGKQQDTLKLFANRYKQKTNKYILQEKHTHIKQQIMLLQLQTNKISKINNNATQSKHV